MYWKGKFQDGGLERTHFALTDLYATFAGILGHKLGSSDALDSFDVLDQDFQFRRPAHSFPRMKFCNLGLLSGMMH